MGAVVAPLLKHAFKAALDSNPGPKTVLDYVMISTTSKQRGTRPLDYSFIKLTISFDTE